jgi:xylose isomerase
MNQGGAMMTKALKHGLLSGGFEDPVDMYVAGGYKPSVDMNEILDRICSIDRLEGVGLCESSNFTLESIPKASEVLRGAGKDLIGLFPDITSRPYVCGSISASDKAVRRKAIDHIKRHMDLAKTLKAPLVGLWLGNDGTDYYFSADYFDRWNWIIDGLSEICGHDSSVKISICNKIKEPRIHCHISTTGKLVALIKQVGAANLGVTLDASHSMQNYELVGENVAFIDRFVGRERIFLTLASDNWRAWDDMIIPGSVNTIEWIEYFFCLDKIDYNGWILSDEVAFREDVVGAIETGIDLMNGLFRAMRKIDKEEMQKAMECADPLRSLKLIRQVLLP